jgi:arabinogalactan endo-1,4-beta-galactosidase
VRSSHRPVCSAAVVATLLVTGCGPGAEEQEAVLGVDLSYVNEVEACGAVYRDADGRTDPFEIVSAHGANLVRARLWHDPDWTEYSGIEDVIRTFERAKEHGMATLLDFHYSDDWADPGKQQPPAAWASLRDTDELAAALGDYTTSVLTRLDQEGLLPDIVQVGNEINGGLVKARVGLDWTHDRPLLEAGIAAVREVSDQIDVMLHVAQPENGLWWFAEAETAGLTDFDVIGLSYYPQWSQLSIAELGSAVQRLGASYGKDVLVVETGYPWTGETSGDTADNVLNQGLRQYPMAPQGQLAFMEDLTTAVVANGGLGTVYWEPAWLSTGCRTQWGQGSHWENATLFDFSGVLHAGAGYLAADYTRVAAPEFEGPVLDDPSGDASSPAADMTALSVDLDETWIGVSTTLSRQPDNWSGAIALALSTSPGGGDGDRRPFDYDDAIRPEVVLETSFEDEPGVGFASTVLQHWRDGEWADSTFTGSVLSELHDAGGITITWAVPAALVGRPEAFDLSVFTLGRGRAGGLDDFFGGESGSGVLAPSASIRVES